MVEELSLQSSKEDRYKELIPQIEALVASKTDLIANLANISAGLKTAMGFFWVGFYIVKDEELVLGPFQDPIACTRIKKGKGVCGQAWEREESIIVSDVDQFPGHIACSSASKSEIVVPVMVNDKVVGVLDVDSNVLSDCDVMDRRFLERLVGALEETWVTPVALDI